MRKLRGFGSIFAIAGALALIVPLVIASESSTVQDAAVDRTREQVKMLDDLYKTAVVLITEHYVQDPSTLSGASAAKALFEAMKKKGWHDVRLVGLTDAVVNDVNKPMDAFEREAKTKLLAGEASHEAVVTESGKRYLRFATPLPVVMEKCVMCHESYKGNDGVIGSLAYKVPLVE